MFKTEKSVNNCMGNPNDTLVIRGVERIPTTCYKQTYSEQ